MPVIGRRGRISSCGCQVSPMGRPILPGAQEAAEGGRVAPQGVGVVAGHELEVGQPVEPVVLPGGADEGPRHSASPSASGQARAEVVHQNDVQVGETVGRAQSISASESSTGVAAPRLPVGAQPFVAGVASSANVDATVSVSVPGWNSSAIVSPWPAPGRPAPRGGRRPRWR